MAPSGSIMKGSFVKERSRLSFIRALPRHQNTLSMSEAIAAKKKWKCVLPPHLHEIWLKLTHRLQYAKRRCDSPSCEGYKTYGARGIKFKFKSVRESVLWVAENLPHPNYAGVEIDRIDNDGHYEPGNLQLSTRRENANNRYTTFWVPTLRGPLAMQDFKRTYPECGYGRDRIKDLVERGLTGEQITYRWQFERGKHLVKKPYKKRGKYKPETRPRKKRGSTIL